MGRRGLLTGALFPYSEGHIIQSEMSRALCDKIEKLQNAKQSAKITEVNSRKSEIITKIAAITNNHKNLLKFSKCNATLALCSLAGEQVNK